MWVSEIFIMALFPLLLYSLCFFFWDIYLHLCFTFLLCWISVAIVRMALSKFFWTLFVSLYITHFLLYHIDVTHLLLYHVDVTCFLLYPFDMGCFLLFHLGLGHMSCTLHKLPLLFKSHRQKNLTLLRNDCFRILQIFEKFLIRSVWFWLESLYSFTH